LTAMRPQALAVAREMSLERHLDRLETLFDACNATAQPMAAGE